MKKIKVSIIGLGNRGRSVYAPIFEKNKNIEIVAIAEKDENRLYEVKKKYNIDERNCFKSAEELLLKEKLSDVVAICTQDKQHVTQAIKAIEKGYDILMEKPVSPNIDECKKLLKVYNKYKSKVVICHSLRYTDTFKTVKKILNKREIGKIVSIRAVENVGYWHQAHSFVRGNWNNSDETSPMIVQKCCHDMDLIVWLTEKKCEKISSFGSLKLFKEENAPEGATKRCMDGCKVKETCPYDAEKIYLYHKKLGILSGNKDWPVNVLSQNPTIDSIKEAITYGEYGRCVYYCDNNVVDNQVVNLKMEDNISVSFEMCGFSPEHGRTMEIFGTMGKIEINLKKRKIIINKFGENPYEINFDKDEKDIQGYSEAETELIDQFVEYIVNGNKKAGITSLEDSIESHYMAFYAEYSRVLDGKCIKLNEFR